MIWAKWMEVGGPWTYILLLVAPAIVGAGLLHLVLRRRVSLWLLAMLIAAVFGIGLFGTQTARGRVDYAVRMARPAEQAMLTVRGYEEASHSWQMMLALGAAGIVFLIAGEIGRAHRRAGK